MRLRCPSLLPPGLGPPVAAPVSQTSSAHAFPALLALFASLLLLLCLVTSDSSLKAQLSVPCSAARFVRWPVGGSVSLCSTPVFFRLPHTASFVLWSQVQVRGATID